MIAISASLYQKNQKNQLLPLISPWVIFGPATLLLDPDLDIPWFMMLKGNRFPSGVFEFLFAINPTKALFWLLLFLGAFVSSF